MKRDFHAPFRQIAVLFMALASLLCVHSCVDKDFRLDDIDTEITVGNDDLVIPLGYVEEKSIGEIIGTNIEELTADADGNYSIGYKGNDSFAIDGISERGFSTGSQSIDTDISYPHVEITDVAYNIDSSFTVGLPEQLSFITSLPQDLNTAITADNAVDFAIDLTIPQQIAAVNKIYLGEDKKGAKIDFTLDFNGVAPINGGGRSTIAFTAPEGYELWNGIDETTAGNTLTISESVASGATSRTFAIYLRSIDTSHYTIENGKMQFAGQLQSVIRYEFTAKGGRTFDPSDKPQIRLASALKYRDADVALSRFSLDDTIRRLEESLIIRDIIKEIKYVSEVVLKNTRITVRITGIDWLSDTLAEAANVKIKLPAMFVLEDTGLHLDDAGNIDTNIKQLREGLTIGLAKIVPDEIFRTPDADGKIDLGFAVDVTIGEIAQGLRVKASELLYNSNVSIGISFMDATFYIESIAGKVAYSATEHTSLDLSNIAEYDISAKDLDVSPVLSFAIDNPFSVPIDAVVELVPYKDGTPITDNKVTARGIDIAAASRTDSAHTDIVIAKADRRGDFPAAKFVEADITRLFKGTMPDKVDVLIHAATDEEESYTIYARERYDVAYTYDVDIPLAFGENFSISYSDTIKDLDDAFADLADQDITVGEVSITAAVSNSTPLDFAIDALLLDSEGNPTEAQIVIDDTHNKALGSTDGKVRESVVVLHVVLGDDNNLRHLADAVALRLTLTAETAKGGQSGLKLNKNQTLSATLKLNIKGGITTDIDKL